MAQAHIALETPRAASLWMRMLARANALVTTVKQRRAERREVTRLLAQRQSGLETGARV